MKTDPLPIEHLILDVQNPRITKADNQRDALQRILDDQQTNLAVLAQDIAANGLNPMDRWLVLPTDEEGDHVVIEGNRRLAAIKILVNPAVLGDLQLPARLKKKLEAIAATFDPASISPIDCFIVADRTSAAPWIQQRHTGANEGKGIVNWSGVATARFRGGGVALQAFDFVMAEGGFSAAKQEEIENKFPITTLDRLMSTPAVRTIIGVQSSKGELSTDLPFPDLIKVLRKIVLDLSEGKVNVNNLKSKEQQINYVSNLVDVLPDPAKRHGAFRPIAQKEADTARDANDEPGESETPPAPKPATPRPRKALIPADCKLNVDIPKIRKVEDELRKMPLILYPNAISTLLRVFLELSVDAYLTRRGIPLSITVTGPREKDKSLAVKVKECLSALEADGVPTKDLKGVRLGINSPNSPLHIDTLHSYIHNAHVGAIEGDLTTAFDNARPFFEGIWK